MQMDYEDKNFKSTWKNGILRIRIRTVADNTFNLMRIIFDAAVEHDKFNLAIDARELQTLSFRQIWSVGSFASELKYKISQYVGKMSLIIPLKYHRTMNLILRCTGPDCPYYITENPKDAKQFVM